MRGVDLKSAGMVHKSRYCVRNSVRYRLGFDVGTVNRGLEVEVYNIMQCGDNYNQLLEYIDQSAEY